MDLAFFTTSGLEEFSIQDAKSVGDLAAENFFYRLQIERFDDPDLERVRQWLREEIRKRDVTALTVQRRVESEVTRAVEASSAVLIGSSVGSVIEFYLNVHGVAAALAGFGTAIIVYFGSRLVLRRRPLLPRQIALRLNVLEVLCHFLEIFLDTDIDRTVPSAESAIRRATSVRIWEQAAIAGDDKDPQGLPRPSDDPDTVESSWGPVPDLSPTPADLHTIVRTTRSSPASREPSLSEALTQGYRLSEFEAAVRRLTDLAGHVNDHLVQAALIELEAAITTASSAEEFFVAVMKALNSLSR